MEFLGSFYRANLEAEAMGEHSLRADLSINIVRRLNLSQGDMLSVALPSERIRVFAGQ